MGYTTEFEGAYDITGIMTREFVEYIKRFSTTRRMKRNVEELKKEHLNWEKLCFEGNLGTEGEYFAPISMNFGQEKDDSIIDYNRPPSTQPELWCQWLIETNEDIKNKEITEFTGRLVWDGGEKFYSYVEWLEYMIRNFFISKGFELNGVTLAVGESSDDATYIVVDRNKISTYDALNEDSVDKIKLKYNDNKVVLNYLSEVGKTPEEISDTYWDYYDEDDDW